MNVKKIKEFVKEYKGEIAMGCLVAVAGVAGVMFCKKVAIPKVEADHEKLEKDLELLNTIATIWDKASAGADSAVPIAGDDLITLCGEDYIAVCAGEPLKVTGAILFGNKVET